jgi:hypothetical protein
MALPLSLPVTKEWLGPNLDPMRIRRRHARALYPARVLVHRNELLVLEDGKGGVADGGEIGRDKERSCDEAPKGKMCYLLLVGQPHVANLAVLLRRGEERAERLSG